MKTALAQLRAKTDRELAVLIRKEFERAIELTAEGRYAEAAKIGEQARALLSVANLPVQERARIAEGQAVFQSFEPKSTGRSAGRAGTGRNHGRVAPKGVARPGESATGRVRGPGRRKSPTRSAPRKCTTTSRTTGRSRSTATWN